MAYVHKWTFTGWVENACISESALGSMIYSRIQRLSCNPPNLERHFNTQLRFVEVFSRYVKWPYYAVLPCDLANGKHKKTLQPVNLVLRFREKDVALCEASCYRKFIYSMFPPTNRQPSAHQRWNPLSESVFTSFSQAIGTQGKWKTDSSCMIYSSKS